MRSWTASLALAALAAAAVASPAASAPAGSLVEPHVFPIPWKPGSGDAAFDVGFVTFSNLPAGTRVTIYTIRGSRVWDDRADANGVLRWYGQNERGLKAGTGTYLVLFDGGGLKTTRRVVLIR